METGKYSIIKYILLIVFALVVYIYVNIKDPEWKKEVIAEYRASQYNGVIVDFFFNKTNQIVVQENDSVFNMYSIDRELMVVVDVGDSIIKFAGIDECIIVKQNKSKYLVYHLDRFRTKLPKKNKAYNELKKKYPDLILFDKTDEYLKKEYDLKKIKGIRF